MDEEQDVELTLEQEILLDNILADEICNSKIKNLNLNKTARSNNDAQTTSKEQ